MRMIALVPMLALAATVVACDSTGTAPRSGGNTSFRLSQVGSSGAAASLVALDDHEGGGGHANRLNLADIRSIMIHFTGIAALPILANDDSAEEAQWVKLAAVHPMWINLLDLPTKPDSGLLVQRGTLPAGTFGHLRLLFDSSTITFAQTVQLQHGDQTKTFFADSTYPLCIGGFNSADSMTEKDADDANHFGIVVPATTFTTKSDSASTIDVVFNPGATVQRVFLTGKCLRMTPVIRAARQEEPEDTAGEHRSGEND